MDQTTPPSTQPPASQPTHRGGGFFAGARRLGLWRSDNRWIGGVAGGLGERYGLDPLLVRGIFAATALLGGVGLVAYGVGWALLPEQRDGRIHLEETLAGRFDVALLGALAFVVVGLGRGDNGFWWGGPGWLTAIAWIAVVATVVAVIVVTATNRHSRRRPPYGPPYGPPSGPAPYGGSAPYYAAAAASQAPGTTTTSATGGPATPYPASGPYPATGQRPPAGQYPAAGQYPTVPGHGGAPYPTGPSTTYAARTATAPPQHAPYGPTGGGTPPYVPYVPPTPPTPPRPPKPVKRRPSGPGVATVGVVVALSFLTLAGVLVAHRSHHFHEPVLLTALGISIVLAGIGIVVSGLRGRTSGALGALSILGLIAAVPIGIATTADWHDGARHRAVAVDLAPVSRQVAEQGWSFGVGDTTLDLTRLPLTADTLVVPVSVGAGDLTVIVPADSSVTADVHLGAGEISWNLEPTSVDSGLGLKESFATHDAGADPQIHLNVSAGAGTIRVQEQ